MLDVLIESYAQYLWKVGFDTWLLDLLVLDLYLIAMI